MGSQHGFTKEVFAGFPPLLQNYLETCGYIGSPRKSVLNMEYKKVDFALGLNRPKLKIDYSQFDFADAPTRLAFIDSKMFGVPFQGYDYYIEGKGGMKGVLAKLFQLFDQTGKEIERPTIFRAVWKYPDQDFVYFDGKISSVDGVEVK